MTFDFLEWMETFAMQYGYFGVFFISLIGSLSIIIPIPYTILIYIMGATLNPILVAIASGFGSAVGEFSGYALGYYGRAVISEERQRKMDFMVKVFNRYGFFAIFFFALTPLPDDLLFIPLGIMRYKFAKAFVPSFLGKLLMSFILAYSGRLSIGFIRQLLGGDGWIGAIITTILLIITIVAILKIDWEKVFEKYVGERKT
ncbi:MAG: VTT domain-containing protein [Candidatus Bathyarchaeota archaeon]|jgi:membrane protein DedA with SNARE-associated domain